MLRSFLRWFSKPTPPKPIEVVSPTVTVYAKIPQQSNRSSRAQAADSKNSDAPVILPFVSPQRGGSAASNSPSTARVDSRPATSHRQRVLSMKLVHTQICSAQRGKRLASMGVVTAGDLAFSDPAVLAKNFGAPRKAARVLAQYRRAVRLAASVPGLMPHDAVLLVSIHRRSVRGLARETPGALYRDLERFAESSKGRVQLRGRRIPSARRLKRWIVQCETAPDSKPMHAQAA